VGGMDGRERQESWAMHSKVYVEGTAWLQKRGEKKCTIGEKKARARYSAAEQAGGRKNQVDAKRTLQT